MSASRNSSFSTVLAFCGLALALLVSLPSVGQDRKNSGNSNNEGFSLGFSKNVSAKELGLPPYPGARLHKDTTQDNPAAQMWAGSSNSGFKLVVLKLESDDSPEKVIAFYRRALARYGNVLDCSAAKATASDSNSSQSQDCNDDHPEPGKVELSAGGKGAKHIVAIQPNGKGSVFQLVYIETRGSEE